MALLGWPGCSKLYLCRSNSLCGLSICCFLQDEACNFFWEIRWFSKVKLVSFSWHEYSFQDVPLPKTKNAFIKRWSLKGYWHANEQANKQPGSENGEDIYPYKIMWMIYWETKRVSAVDWIYNIHSEHARDRRKIAEGVHSLSATQGLFLKNVVDS